CQDWLTSDFVRQDGRHWNADDESEDRDQLDFQEVGVGDAQSQALGWITDTEGQDPGGNQVEQGIATDHDEGADKHWLGGDLKDLGYWCLDLLALIYRILENRGFFQLQADVQTDEDHHRRRQEWNAPAPFHKWAGSITTGIAQCGNQDEEQAIGQEETERRTELRPHCRGRALAFFRSLRSQQCRARPFATQAQALAEAHERQKRRRNDACRGISGQQTDDERGNAHGQQSAHQGRLAPDAVAEVAKDHRSQRPSHESQTKGRKRLQQCYRRIFSGREEEQREDSYSRSGVDVEVIKLNGGADG